MVRKIHILVKKKWYAVFSPHCFPPDPVFSTDLVPWDPDRTFSTNPFFTKHMFITIITWDISVSNITSWLNMPVWLSTSVKTLKKPTLMCCNPSLNLILKLWVVFEVIDALYEEESLLRDWHGKLEKSSWLQSKVISHLRGSPLIRRFTLSLYWTLINMRELLHLQSQKEQTGRAFMPET